MMKSKKTDDIIKAWLEKISKHSMTTPVGRRKSRIIAHEIIGSVLKCKHGNRDSYRVI